VRLGQASQSTPPVPFRKEPGPHSVHELEPSRVANEPGKQARHVLSLVAPVCGLCFPTAHGKHVELLDAPRAPL